MAAKEAAAMAAGEGDMDTNLEDGVMFSLPSGQQVGLEWCAQRLRTACKVHVHGHMRICNCAHIHTSALKQKHTWSLEREKRSSPMLECRPNAAHICPM